MSPVQFRPQAPSYSAESLGQIVASRPSSPVIGIPLDLCPPGGYAAHSTWYALRTQYATCLQNQGGCPLFLPYAMEHVAHYLALCDGILIAGGDFDPDPALYGQSPHPSVTLKPDRTQFEYALLSQALETSIPILGICGGMQLLNVVRGGRLIQDIPSMTPEALEHRSLGISPLPTHTVHIQPETALFRITQTSTCRVNTSHHQAVENLGQGLIASAHAEDGIIEAIEDPQSPFCLGIQWHPEYETLAMESKLLHAFVQAAAQYRLCRFG